MLPGVQAQEGDDVGAAGRQVGEARSGVAGARLRALHEGVHRGPVGRRRVPVDALAAPVRGRVGRAGQVGGQDAQVLRVGVLDQPHEPGAEHAQRDREELAAQRLDGAELLLQLQPELGRDPALGHV